MLSENLHLQHSLRNLVSISKGYCRSSNESTGTEHKQFFKSSNAFVVTVPHEIFLATTLGHLAKGPCNMGESQQKTWDRNWKGLRSFEAQ
jgi:hypothetical protein